MSAWTQSVIAGYCLAGFPIPRNGLCPECGARDMDKCKRWDYHDMKPLVDTDHDDHGGTPHDD